MKGTTTIAKMSALIRRGNIDVAFLGMLRDFLETAPYCQDANTEGHYQQMMYVIFSILNPYVDMVLRTAKHLHLFKLKLNKDAETAMRHIDLKLPQALHAVRTANSEVGINFDVEKHNITYWTVDVS